MEYLGYILTQHGVKPIPKKIETMLRELDELRPKAQLLQLSLTDQDLSVTTLAGQMSSQTELLNQKSSAFNEEQIFFHQQENRIRSIEQEIKFKQESLESSQTRIQVNTVELHRNEEEIRNILEHAETNDTELVSMYSAKDVMEQSVNDAERDYYESRGKIDQTEKELRVIQQQREGSDTLLLHLQQELSDSKLELNSVKDRLSVEFNIALDTLLEAEPETPETQDEEQLKTAVQRIREKLDNMGPINPMAMEAYNEIKERNDFIIAQREDLFKAKESLLSTINEIEDVASKTFMEAFEQIKKHFIRVFQSLFNEGDACDLKLLDPSRPLESEIDIIAKPKGKRPLTINQLSGGEKTLTATALLFSMYLLKPAPFCIFDEVDAPLDDANIDKFNQIIRSFSNESQFVIVTHNKRTMSSTDVIYGITMVEKGVSRVVPVDLRELA